MRYRLLQARVPSDPVRDEERAAFAARMDIPVTDIVQHDLLTGPTNLEVVTRDVDAVLVGGSGEFSVTGNAPWLPAFVDTLGALADASFPTFASCFGFQGLVLALGGTVETHEDRAEVGTFEVQLTPEATDDPLLGGLPQRFNAQLGHKDHAIRWPSGCTNLAFSERCAYQALRTGNGRVYATQFHPELNHRDNLLRFQRYEVQYKKAFGAERYERMVEGFQPSPHASSVLGRFRALLESGFKA